MLHKYIFAGNYSQFISYCRHRKLNPHKDVSYISGPHSVFGIIKDSIIVKYGTWYERRDASDILEYLETHCLAISDECDN